MRSYARASKKFNKLAAELRNLNSIMRTMRDDVYLNDIEPDDLHDLALHMKAFGEACDNLSCATVENSQMMTEFTNTVEFAERYGV